MSLSPKRLEVMSSGMLEPTIIVADMERCMHELNMAAAEGRHFIAMTDENDRDVLLETRNITRVRAIDDSDRMFS
jgi:hypothetical protein